MLGVAALALASRSDLQAQPVGGLGAGIPVHAHRCPGTLNAQQEEEVQRELALFNVRKAERELASPAQATGPRLFPIYPQAGLLWQDLYPVNFVDLDPTSGRRDFNGTAQTYDGHNGIDTDLATFAFQDAGVPVFAALDGEVVATHDGEYDRNTTWAGQPANYVVLDHGSGLTTRYYHLRKNSVAVLPGQVVKAGQQIGQTGSSGISTGPHLHFETRQDGVVIEPFVGPARSGASWWKDQVPVRTDTYLREFAFTRESLNGWYYLTDSSRTGTVSQGLQTLYFWIVVGNLPLGSTSRLRFIRPDNSIALDSGTNGLNNAQAYPVSYWWWWYTLDFNQAGTWRLEVSLNGVALITAPLQVTASAAVNRPPNAAPVAFTASVITPADVVVCRVQHPSLLDDPDYDLVRYQWVWRRNGAVVRDVTTAAWADVLPHGVVAGGDTLTCAVTPWDAATAGPVAYASVQVSTPPEIFAQPRHATPNLGTAAMFAVTANGTPPLTYQWYKNDSATAIAGATAASLVIPSVKISDAGQYFVWVSSPAGAVQSSAATLTPIPAGITGGQALTTPGYVPGASLTLTNTIHYPVTATGLSWRVFLPSGWTFASDRGFAGGARPLPGQTGVLEWNWTSLPVGPVVFSYTLNVAGDATGDRELAAVLTVSQGSATPLTVLAWPDPLMVARVSPHSADSDRDFRISLAELLRVLELYQTHRGTIRTGCYRVEPTGEDGFSLDPTRAGTTPVVFTRYHSADTDRDGRINLTEVSRVIEYYRYRIGTLRTGQYRPHAGGEDGFSPGP